MLWIPAWIERMAPGLAGMTVVMRKEMLAQQRQFRGWWLLPRVAFVLVFLAFMAVAMGMLRYFDPSNVESFDYFALSAIGFILNVLVIALVLPQTAGAIARERETGALDLLLLTQLRTREILAGKLLAPMAPLLLIMLPAIPLLLFARLLQWSNPLLPLASLLSLIITLIASGAIGLFTSTLFKNTGQALGTTIAAVILLVYSPLHWLISAIMLPVMLAISVEIGIARGLRKVEKIDSSPNSRLVAIISLSVVFLTLEIFAVYLLFSGDSFGNGDLLMALYLIIPTITLLCLGGLAFYLALRRLNRLRRG